MPDYTRHTEERDIPWFLDHVLVGDIKNAIDAGAGYLAFSLIAQAIEVIGALLDEEEIHSTKPGLGPRRFAHAIDEVFKPINKDYARHNKADSPYYLYEHLRCGMAHVLRPKARVLFTGRADAQKLGYHHLQEVQPEGFAEMQLLMVIEDFHDDLAEACRRAKHQITKKSHSKLKQGYITVTRYIHTYVNEGAAQTLKLDTGASLHLTSPALSGGPIIDLSLTGISPAAAAAMNPPSSLE